MVLKRKGDDPATASVDLANAYGQLGKLLMEAEYRDRPKPVSSCPGADARRCALALLSGTPVRLKGETTKSAASFERVLQLRPDDEPTLVWLGLAYLDAGRPEAGEPMFTQALSIEPGAGPALFGMGRAALARRDYGRAVDIWSRRARTIRRRRSSTIRLRWRIADWVGCRKQTPI